MLTLPKYKERVNLIQHVREFQMTLIDLAYEHTYLMILFIRSLIGQALEWFAHLHSGITTWEELANKFITKFCYNIKNDITIATPCHTK
jgi:thiamine transporter ThiT